jgi:hypothetical protein
MNTAPLVPSNSKTRSSLTSENGPSISLWACLGFDGINDLQFHAGTGAHRNENQTIVATVHGDSVKNAKVLAFPVRSAASLQMAA